MSAALGESALGLAAGVGLLFVTLVSIRLRAGAQRRRRRELRPEAERELALFLARDGAAPPRPRPGRLGGAVFLQVALDAIVELRGRERERITELLEQLGVVAEVSRGLEARSARRRRAAADTLAVIRSARAEQALERRLSDGDALVRLSCARALAELGRERAGADVAAAIAVEPEASLGGVADALLALGANRPDSLGPLIEDGSAPAVQALAAAVAGELRLVQHAPALRRLLDSPNAEVAARAARGLGLMGDTEAAGPLVELVTDPSRAWFVRAAAVRALGAIGDPSALPALRRQLYAEEWQLQANAATALAALGDAGAEALRAALRSGHERARAHARVALEGAAP